ncbi:Hypothetical protein ACI5QL_02705 [Bacillus velezensis]
MKTIVIFSYKFSEKVKNLLKFLLNKTQLIDMTDRFVPWSNFFSAHLYDLLLIGKY